MTNLKKMIALSLVATSILSTSVYATTFTDHSDINKTEAVDTLVALNVIVGYLDGSFKPLNDVSRAEMAKMIYTIKNGGNDDASMFKELSTTFTDINGHWAEGYIKYCSNQGIIAGRSDEIYDPNANVTGLEALKMALVSLGYDADVSNLVGSDWEANTLVLSLSNNLTSNYTGSLGSNASRENSAVILHNALFTETVRYNSAVSDYIGSDKLLAEVSMNLEIFSNVYISDSDIETGLSFLSNADDTHPSSPLTTEKDFTSYIGQKVEILADTKSNEVYGIKSYSTNKIINTEASNLSISASNVVSFDGVSITVSLEDAETLSNASANTLVSIVDNGSFVTTSVKEIITGSVLYVNDEKIHVSATGYQTGALTFEDDNISADIKVGDFVQIIENDFTNNQEVVVLEKQSGVVTAKRDNEFRIDGEWFTVVSGETNPELNTEVSYYQIGSVLYEVSAETLVSYDHLYVVDAVPATNNFDTNKASVVLTDGTSLVIETANDESSNVGSIVSYSVTDGVYSFSTVNDSFTSKTPSGNIYENSRLAGFLVNSDAEVFVKYDTDKLTVLSGSEVRAWGDVLTSATSENASIYTKSSNGFDYVSLAFIDLGESNLPNATTADVFGFVTETPYEVRVNNVTYSQVTVFNGTQSIDVLVSSLAQDVTKGSFVNFELSSDGQTATSMTTIENLTLDAIKGLDLNDGEILFEGLTSESSDDISAKITSNTTTIFVDSTNVVGVTGANLCLATDNDGDGVLENNVYALVVDGEVIVLFADIANQMKV